MPSPFPGMNPYLEHEDAWHTFHKLLLPALLTALVPQLGQRYFVMLGEHAYAHEIPDESRGRVTDVERTAYIEVRERQTRRAATVIEVLSQSAKTPGPYRRQYLKQRSEWLLKPTNLVEIDLLRGGERLPYGPPLTCDYCTAVSRHGQRPAAALWPVSLRAPLPVIPIPVSGNDPNLAVDLQAVLHRLYDSAGFANFIYDSEPDPRLSPEDAAWAREILSSAGIRPAG